jgi:hypothetical protein
MGSEQMTASTTVDAPPDAVFAVLADPSNHVAIDGTGWVKEDQDGRRITAVGQVFRIGMYHENHPDGDYDIANLVEVFDEPAAIGWKPGTEDGPDGALAHGGWSWRYDLEEVAPSQTKVTLTYDWSGATPESRAVIQFPPFGQDHLDQSLQHLATLATT